MTETFADDDLLGWLSRTYRSRSMSSRKLQFSSANSWLWLSICITSHPATDSVSEIITHFSICKPLVHHCTPVWKLPAESTMLS